MICFHALGTKFSIPLLTLLTPMLAMKLGFQGNLAGILFSLSIHEFAHVAAAKWRRVQITEVRLMPFGGSARMENPYGISAMRMIPVAAAGPAANLLSAVIFAALTQWDILDNETCNQYIHPNLVLFLFNLLPALPLDGGRILYALLQRCLGEDRALKTGLYLGRMLSATLIAFAIWSSFTGGKWNLSFILAAIFILVSENDEKKALASARARRLSALMDADIAPHPVRLYQMDITATVNQALKLLRPQEQTWFLLTNTGQPEGTIDGKNILDFLVHGGAPDAAMESLPYWGISFTERTGAQPFNH